MEEHKMGTMPINKLLLTMAAPMILSMIIGAVLNIILDPILIFGYFGFPELGTAGAVIATVTGQIVAMILGVIFNLAYNLGIKNHKRIYQSMKLSAIYSAIIGILGTFLLQIFPENIMKAFHASEFMTNMGITALRITSTSFVFACLCIMVCYALQGLSMGVPSMIISFLYLRFKVNELNEL